MTTQDKRKKDFHTHLEPDVFDLLAKLATKNRRTLTGEITNLIEQEADRREIRAEE